MNIFSGTPGLGDALTNPTELARRKDSITDRYPVRYLGRDFPDVETAYRALKGAEAAANDELMVQLIACKFDQHPALCAAVRECGGVAFLKTCGHFTGAHTERSKSWEGRGRASRFIRNLIAGFERAGPGAANCRRMRNWGCSEVTPFTCDKTVAILRTYSTGQTHRGAHD